MLRRISISSGIDLSDQFITASVKATMAAAGQPPPRCLRRWRMSLRSKPSSRRSRHSNRRRTTPENRRRSDDGRRRAGGKSGTSFSEIAELPPLKEAYVAPPPPSVLLPASTGDSVHRPPCFPAVRNTTRSPKFSRAKWPRKAIKEIKNVPPKLHALRLGGAGVLILPIGIGVTIYIHSLRTVTMTLVPDGRPR